MTGQRVPKKTKRNGRRNPWEWLYNRAILPQYEYLLHGSFLSDVVWKPESFAFALLLKM
jgi:hypothetical protein